MTLLHQAAQKAVEALRKIAKPGYGLEFGDSDTERADYWHGVAASCRRQASAIAEFLESALQQQEVPVASIVYEAYSKTGSYLFASEEGADEFASRFPATAAMSVRARPIIGAALQQQEVPREPVAHYEQMRLTLIGQVHELLDIAERHAWANDPDEKRRTEGAIAHARKVTAPYNYNGAASPSTTQQQEAGNGWKLAPVEPTREMIRAASVIRATMVDGGEWYVGIGGAIDAYEAMLAAAPSTPESAEKDDAGGVNASVEAIDKSHERVDSEVQGGHVAGVKEVDRG